MTVEERRGFNFRARKKLKHACKAARIERAAEKEKAEVSEEVEDEMPALPGNQTILSCTCSG